MIHITVAIVMRTVRGVHFNGGEWPKRLSACS